MSCCEIWLLSFREVVLVLPSLPTTQVFRAFTGGHNKNTSIQLRAMLEASLEAIQLKVMQLANRLAKLRGLRGGVTICGVWGAVKEVE